MNHEGTFSEYPYSFPLPLSIESSIIQTKDHLSNEFHQSNLVDSKSGVSVNEEFAIGVITSVSRTSIRSFVVDLTGV